MLFPVLEKGDGIDCVESMVLKAERPCYSHFEFFPSRLTLVHEQYTGSLIRSVCSGRPTTHLHKWCSPVIGTGACPV